MTRVDYPPLKWKRRFYQEPLWQYLVNGGRHAELIWHRRAGKDEVSMYHTGCEMLETPATYWHMLPKANQVRKAIWEAVNPHTGVRRIEEVFPKTLFNHRDTDMFVRSKSNASTWQCLGSDNFEGAIGSPPLGIVYSEWAMANPSVRGYLRPIIAENKGWQIFITTPRGKNHAYRTFNAARRNAGSFAEKLTIHDTGVLTARELIVELQEYVDTYGSDQGLALYEQEYECSFEAAILGAYYAHEFNQIDAEDRITSVVHNPNYPVHVAMDIGRSDDTVLIFFQSYASQLFVIDYLAENGRDPEYYMGVIAGYPCQVDIVDNKCRVQWGTTPLPEWKHHNDWEYGTILMPHDAKHKHFGTLKSGEEQFAAGFGWNIVQIVQSLSLQDGINASRLAFKRAIFDEVRLEDGISAWRAYHREWDDEKKRFMDTPRHDWSSHPADAWRYLAIAWTRDKLPAEKTETRYGTDRTFDEWVKLNTARRKRNQGG